MQSNHSCFYNYSLDYKTPQGSHRTYFLLLSHWGNSTVQSSYLDSRDFLFESLWCCINGKKNMEGYVFYSSERKKKRVPKACPYTDFLELLFKSKHFNWEYLFYEVELSLIWISVFIQWFPKDMENKKW